MFDVIGIADNYTIVPAPVLDESQPKGYRIEQRMQVTLKAASSERAYTVEFRLGETSQAPSEELLNRWIESGDMVQAFCIGLTARPFVHQEGKNYQARGSQKEINGTLTTLDTFVVFAGFAMAPLAGADGGASSLEEMVKQARGAYKRSLRQYRVQRNAERAKQQEAQLEERARQLLERKAQQEAEKAGIGAGAAPDAVAATSANGRKR